MGKADAVADTACEGMRIDVWLSEVARALTRSQVRARAVRFRVDGKECKPGRKLRAGERVEAEWEDEKPVTLACEDLPLSILYEDDDVIVVDKAQGMVTHPACGHARGTLVNAILGRLVAEAFPDPARAGIVHRLDKDTSGVIIAAKTPEALERAQAEFRSRRAAKTYLAILRGDLPDSGRIENLLARDPRDRTRFAVLPETPSPDEPESEAEGPAGARGGRLKRAGRGKLSVTEWRVVYRQDGYCLVKLSPRTGRTHQLRVHMRHLGAPILGDPVYGRRDRRFPDATLMLHAWKLVMTLPSGARGSFVAPVPERFRRVLRVLRGR